MVFIINTFKQFLQIIIILIKIYDMVLFLQTFILISQIILYKEYFLILFNVLQSLFFITFQLQTFLNYFYKNLIF